MRATDKRDKRVALASAASKVVLGIFILLASGGIVNQIVSSNERHRQEQAELQAETDRQNAQAEQSYQDNLKAQAENEKAARELELQNLKAQAENEKAARELELQRLKAQEADAKEQSIRQQNADQNSACDLVRNYFKAAGSDSQISQATYLSPTVYFFTGDVPIATAQQRMDAQNSSFPYRYFSIVNINVTAPHPNVFNILAVVDMSLGDNHSPVETSRERDFIRVEKTDSNFQITRIGTSAIPGWTLAHYKARISPEDLRQSGSGGKLFASLPWDSNEDFVREVILQDRYNHEAHFTNDPEDETDDYFSVGSSNRLSDLKKLISNHRLEWTQSNMPIQFDGTRDQLTSGSAIIEVEVLKDEAVIVHLIDSGVSSPVSPTN